MVNKQPYAFVISILAVGSGTLLAGEDNRARYPSPRVSEQTKACLDCHKTLTPGIVEDWLTSRHAKTTPAQALKKPLLGRRVSSKDIPQYLRTNVVGCYECHGLNPDRHKDNFDHMGARVNVVVSPDDCRVCHSEEAGQFSGSKKAHALGNLRNNPLFHSMVDTITGAREFKGGALVSAGSSETTKAQTCYACHGTEVSVAGMKTVSTSMGDVEVPLLANWPNQGVGRINPDGSLGSCAACHPRHSFSIEIARKPRTCAQCHLEPDAPAWEVYQESKHGNIALSKEREWTWEAVPWKVGRDFRTPTCAACHNSLLTGPEGEVIAPRTHDFGSRLWVRIFGLPFSHPQPKTGDTSLIKNKDGLSLPTTFEGEEAGTHLIDEPTQAVRKQAMQDICRSCHSSGWAAGHFARLDAAVKETDKMTSAATEMVRKAWDAGWADRSNPFDEFIEQAWVQQWLFYATSARYAAAMGGADHASFKGGWWEMQKTLQEMKEWLESKEAKTSR